MSRKVVIVCRVCGCRLVGVLHTDGMLYAARVPDPDAPVIPGWCWTCKAIEESEPTAPALDTNTSIL